MTFILGIFYMCVGVLFLWFGAFQFITALVPHDVGVQFAEEHGRWMRDHIFGLSITDERQDTLCAKNGGK